MSETFPSDSNLENKNDSTDTDTGFHYPEKTSVPASTEGYRALWQLLGRCVSALQVYKDGALTFGVRAGKFMDGDTQRSYSAVTGQSLTDDATNYIYLTAAGTLTKNTTGFPNPSLTPHIRLATIVCADGAYDPDPANGDLVDFRFACLFGILHGIGPATLQDQVPQLDLSGTDDTDGTGTMTIQAQDAGGNALAQRFLARAWIADAEYSEPDAQTDFSVTTGEQMREIEADADYEVISDGSGTIVMNIDAATDKTVYVMAEVDGRIWTGSVAITGN